MYAYIFNIVSHEHRQYVHITAIVILSPIYCVYKDNVKTE